MRFLLGFSTIFIPFSFKSLPPSYLNFFLICFLFLSHGLLFFIAPINPHLVISLPLSPISISLSFFPFLFHLFFVYFQFSLAFSTSSFFCCCCFLFPLLLHFHFLFFSAPFYIPFYIHSFIHSFLSPFLRSLLIPHLLSSTFPFPLLFTFISCLSSFILCPSSYISFFFIIILSFLSLLSTSILFFPNIFIAHFPFSFSPLPSPYHFLSYVFPFPKCPSFTDLPPRPCPSPSLAFLSLASPGSPL